MYKKMILSILLTLLMTLVLGPLKGGPIPVQAQGDPQSEAANLVTDALMEADRLENPSMALAYEVFRTIVQDFDFQDLLSEDPSGTSLDDFLAHMDLGVDPKVQAVTDTDVFVSWIFPLDQAQGEGSTELVAYFMYERLSFVGIASLSNYMIHEGTRFLPAQVIEDWIFAEDPVSLADIGDEPFHVVGLSQMVYEGKPVNVFMVPSQAKNEDITIDSVVAYDGLIQNSIADSPLILDGRPNFLLLETSIQWAAHVLGQR